MSNATDTGSLLAFGAALVSGALAVLVGWRERHSPAHWSFAAGMGLLTVESIFNGLASDSAAGEEGLHYHYGALLCQALLAPAWLVFSLAYGRGNFREFLIKWRFILIAFFLLPAAPVIFLRGNFPALLEQNRAVRAFWRWGAPDYWVNLFFLVGAIVVLMNLERTFRASVGTMRWRIKFTLLGVGMLFVVRLFTSTLVLLFHASVPAWQTVNTGALIMACALILRSLMRSGPGDISVYPSHAVLQGSLTVLLAGIYLLLTGVFAQAVTFGGGDAAFTLKAFVLLVALVMLAVFLLSDRLRWHARRWVSRHFQRPLYDYHTVWKKFTECTALCVTQNELCNAALKLLTDVFQCLSVTIWLADDTQEQMVFAASTFLSEAQAGGLVPKNRRTSEAIRALRQHPEPADLDSSREPWAELLKQSHPHQFDLGGNRVCVPLTAGGEFLGLVILGDRVAGHYFSGQDFDLLQCVGDQIAASLLNIRLSQKLLQTKELEAFQTMSAFFVHDLKNAASTLSLMLQNLPVHFDDPAFRADALRGTAKSVAHINRLIERLGHLRSELTIRPAQADLNDVVSKALVDWETTSDINLVTDLRPLPKLFIDSEQLLKVVTNLVLNSRDAVPSAGRIRVATSQANGWAVLSVSDNGCGMPPEFLHRSLFRPFQTTKKSGLGIGMFQSKMIIAAHRGRIEVESELAKGTTFRVLLPLQT